MDGLGGGKIPAVVLAVDINGLGVLRSLHRAGIPTIAVATDPRDPVLKSRLPMGKWLVPPGEPDKALLDTLTLITGARLVLIPTSDAHVSFLLRHRETLARHFAFCLPSSTVAESLLDKQAQAELVGALGIPIPRTVLQLRAPYDERLEALGLPIIFKPRTFADRHLLGCKNVVVHTARERDLFLTRHAQVLPGLVAQEVIPGPDDQLWVCNCTFDRDHSLVGAFTFRRLSLSPAHYGVTSYAVSHRNDKVVELVAALGRALRYVGPAMIEFKRDLRDQKYKFIEINPRLGMCNAFDTRCGVENALNTYKLSLGERPAAMDTPQRDQVMFLSLFDDVDSRRSEGATLAATLRRYARHLGRPHVGAYFAWNDPAPAGLVALREASRVLEGLGRKLRPAPFTQPDLVPALRRSEDAAVDQRSLGRGLVGRAVHGLGQQLDEALRRDVRVVEPGQDVALG
jgi:D-aspartate ligase